MFWVKTACVVLRRSASSVAFAERLRRVLEVEDAAPRHEYSMRRQWGAWFTKILFMRGNDEELFFNFLRVTPAIFDELLRQGAAVHRAP